MENLWYKNAVIYAVDVKAFKDSNGDGIGDLQGLTQQLDYLSGLGITCLWMMPFYLSPHRDNGYDVQDYYQVDPRFGCLGDFVELVHKANELGIRILVDLVVNHTSNQHPWFQQARADKNSRYRQYYVWSDELPDTNEENVLKGKEEGIWHYDEKAQAYYLHRFYKEQPDLNISNPEVREEILKIISFWLQLGVSGFRVDAAHILTQPVGLENEDEELHHLFTEMRNFISRRNSDAVLMAEANVEPQKLEDYFANGTRMHMLFNFFTNKHLFLAMAREEGEPIAEALEELKEIKPSHWANFIRHHDELNLELLTEDEREEVYEQFAPEEDMRIFGHGIRRRLPPMLKNNRARIELIYSLLFSLPGTPLICYGEEIGMGEDLSLEGRESVRTAMQWMDGETGGFSSAPRDQFIKPIIDHGEFSYKKINVARQHCDKDSLLNWMERLIRTRRQCVEVGYGDWEVLETDSVHVFAQCCIWNKRKTITVHNLSGELRKVKLRLDGHSDDRFMYQFGSVPSTDIDENLAMTLPPYGYVWLRANNYM